MSNLRKYEIRCYLPIPGRTFAFDVRKLKEWTIDGSKYEQFRKEGKLNEYFLNGLKFKEEDYD